MARPSFDLPLPVMYSMPTGALLDIPTCEWIRGMHDMRIMNGGIGNITGLVGPGNSGKSTIMRYMVLSAISRAITTAPDDIYYSSYDTEINAHEGRNSRLAAFFDTLKSLDLIKSGIWQITNKAIYSGNKYFAALKDYLTEKRKDKKSYKFTTAFLDRDGVSPMKVMFPSFTDIDSLTQFVTDDVEKMMEDTEIGQKEGNTIFMRQGLAKMRMLMELPSLAAASSHYFMFTAHIGKTINIPAGPTSLPPRKQLSGMREDEIIKGVSNNFFYLLHNCWLLSSSKPFLNQTTRAPEYPFEPGDEVAGDLDLNITALKQLRGKNGSSGFTIEVIWSQQEGVLPGLSEFHYIKKMDRFGMEGNDRSYALTLYPEVSLSRTKVRKTIREDKKLQRALEITSQLCQMFEFQRFMKKELLEIPELKAKLTEKGYDWDFILTHTRGWNTLEDEVHPLFPFSTYDLCRAANGLYRPYWLEEDCKTVKPEYAKKKLGYLPTKEK